MKKSATTSSSTMHTITGLLLLSLIGYSTSASNTRCFPLNEGGSLCFTQPDPLVAMSWSSAKQWCKNIGATLPIPDTSYHHVVYGNALGYFGLHTETLWIGANSTFNLNNWYWTNRTIFTGTIENRNTPGKTHAYIRRNGTNVQFFAASPFEYNNHICQYSYSEVSCGNYGNSYWTGGKCYIKYRYSSSWYQSWSYCGQTNLAAIDNLNELSRWLEDLAKFWIGLRSTWWTWQDIVTGTSREVVESQFGNNLPNGSSAECLTSYRDSGLNVRWMNLNCTSNLQFICQQYVNVTTTTTTTTTTITTKTTTPTTTSTSTTTTAPTTRTTTSTSTTSTTTTPSYSLATASDGGTVTSSTQTVNITYLPKVNSDSNSINYDLALGLGIGLGGGLLLAVIVWLALLTICAYRKIRETKYSLIRLQRQSDGNQKKTAINSYDNRTFNDASGTTEGQEEDIPYEVVERQANEQVYERMNDEDQCRVIGGYRNTIYANTGQIYK